MNSDIAAYDDYCDRLRDERKNEPEPELPPCCSSCGDADCTCSGPSQAFVGDAIFAATRVDVDTVVACDHPLVEVLSINGRNLDGAVRQCGERIKAVR